MFIIIIILYYKTLILPTKKVSNQYTLSDQGLMYNICLVGLTFSDNSGLAFLISEITTRDVIYTCMKLYY